MASAKKYKKKNNHTSIQPKKVTVMRKSQKVARVSICCKLNMLVPQLQRLSSTARLQHEHGLKERNNLK